MNRVKFCDMKAERMPKMSIRLDKKKISIFCKKNHIDFLALFGSILTSDFKETSDVDVLVKFEKDHIPSLFDIGDIESELTAIVGRQVDLRTPNEISKYFRDEVLAQAHVIYEGRA